MRIFRVPAGNYAGQYKIYESREEFKRAVPDGIALLWGECSLEEIKDNSWIEALDGYILQVLRVSINTKGKAIRVCNGSFVVSTHIKKDGSLSTYWQKFYGMVSKTDPYSYSGITVSQAFRGTKMKEMVITFARLVANRVVPIIAYSQAGFSHSKKSTIRFKAAELLLKEEVMHEIQKQQKDFASKMAEDDRFSTEKVLAFVADFMKHVEKGSRLHLESLVPVLTLLGYVEKEVKPTRKNLKAEEVQFNEVQPPTEEEMKD